MYDIQLEESDKVEKSFIWQSSSDFVCITRAIVNNTTKKNSVIIIFLRLRKNIRIIHTHTKLLCETRVLLLAVISPFLSCSHHQHCYCYYYHNQGKWPTACGENMFYNSLSWREARVMTRKEKKMGEFTNAFIQFLIFAGVLALVYLAIFWHSCTFLSFVP